MVVTCMHRLASAAKHARHACLKAMSFNAASMQLMQLHMLQVAAKVVQVASAARYHEMCRWTSCHV